MLLDYNYVLLSFEGGFECYIVIVKYNNGYSVVDYCQRDLDDTGENEIMKLLKYTNSLDDAILFTLDYIINNTFTQLKNNEWVKVKAKYEDDYWIDYINKDYINEDNLMNLIKTMEEEGL